MAVTAKVSAGEIKPDDRATSSRGYAKMDVVANPTSNELLLFRMTLALASAIMEVETVLAEITQALPDNEAKVKVAEARTKVRSGVKDYMTLMREYDAGV
ncbi:MAG: hypothetical protein EOO77_01010 [Oxalobacteraceae bacterium]|nr:MAG: hypothetical protein EOO77_01010 [Oxalobacteraceae bacterium]